MSCYIYCLYSTENGEPRYVGRTSDKVSYRFRQHITAALEKDPGALYDWIRDVWRQGADINVYTLQEGIIPKDVGMFEQYWIDQFADLLNVTGNKTGKTDSAIAQQIKSALQIQLQLVQKSGS